MAANTNKTADKPEEAPKATDYIARIGRNFNPDNAKEIFGDKWIDAMNAVAAAGGYGSFTEADYAKWETGIFGGFAIPQGDGHKATRDGINAALSGLK